MHEPSPRRRLAGRLLLGAAVLALPLTASISYAAADDPAPAATPSPEVATKPVSHMERRMVIVDRQGPENGEAQVKTRTVTRDGTTVVFKTDKPLSDEEIEKRIDEALATAPLPPETPGEEGERRVAVRRVGPAGAASAMAFDTETVSGTNCRNGEPVEVNDTADADGKYRRLRIKICAREIAHAAAEGARAAALDAQAQAEIARDAARSARAEANQALRQARDEVARDKSIPENIRDKVVKDLDAEIERNAKQG